MANLGNNVKTAFLKGLEALGKTASCLTDAAQQKLSEINLETRRREVLSEIPKCVMQLWQDGVEMPEPLTELLTELTGLEEQLTAMRPQPEVKEEEACEDCAEEIPEESVEENAEDAPACECVSEDCCCKISGEPAPEPEENL